MAAGSLKEEDVMKEYASSLADLTVNSKPLINMLTMLADENSAYAPVIVLAIERHLQKVDSDDDDHKRLGTKSSAGRKSSSRKSKVPSDVKLPVLYLIDSIMKNVGKPYPELFTPNIVSTFCSVFEKVDEKTRAQMFKLRHTWNQMFPAKKMYALDARVSAIDPAWPITASLPTMTSIHVNPKFLSIVGSPGAGTAAGQPAGGTTTAAPATPAASTTSTTTPKTTSEEATMNEAALRENLLKKRKELLELQQKKLELELLQTKKKLEEQEKQLEMQTGHLKSEPAPNKQPSIPVAEVVATMPPRKSSKPSFSLMDRTAGRAHHRRTKPVLPGALIPPVAAVTPSVMLKGQKDKTDAPSGDAPVAVNSVPQPVKIAPVSSQLLSAVAQKRIRDPRLIRAAAAQAQALASRETPQTITNNVSSTTMGPHQSKQVIQPPLPQIVLTPSVISTSTHVPPLPIATQHVSNATRAAKSHPLSIPSTVSSTSSTFSVVVTTSPLSLHTTTSTVSTGDINVTSTTMSVTDNQGDNNKHVVEQALVEKARSNQPQSKSIISELLQTKPARSSKSGHSKRERREIRLKEHSERHLKKAKDNEHVKVTSDTTVNSSSSVVSPREKTEDKTEKVLEKQSTIVSGTSNSVGNKEKPVREHRSKRERHERSGRHHKSGLSSGSSSSSLSCIEGSPTKRSLAVLEERAEEKRERVSALTTSPTKSLKGFQRKSPSPGVIENIMSSAVIEKIIFSEEKDEVEPSPPSPPRTVGGVEEKFKELKPSSLDRMRKYTRSREMSNSPPTTTAAQATPTVPSSGNSDMDLRVPPSEITTSAEDVKIVVTDDDAIPAPTIVGLELPLNVADLDLRTMPSVSNTTPGGSEDVLSTPQAIKRMSEEREMITEVQPPIKKSKLEKFDALFGSEDQDMRQDLSVPRLPTPPPPPIISPLTEVNDNSEERMWTKYKQGKPDVYKNYSRHSSRDESAGPYSRRKGTDRLGRPLLYRHQQGSSHSSSRRHRDSGYHESRTSNRYSNRSCNLILKQAQEHLKTGEVSASQYNRVVKEVISLSEQKQLEEARRRDEHESRWARYSKNRDHHPDSEKVNLQNHLDLDPISDDELHSETREVEELKENEEESMPMDTNDGDKVQKKSSSSKAEQVEKVVPLNISEDAVDASSLAETKDDEVHQSTKEEETNEDKFDVGPLLPPPSPPSLSSNPETEHKELPLEEGSRSPELQLKEDKDSSSVKVDVPKKDTTDGAKHLSNCESQVKSKAENQVNDAVPIGFQPMPIGMQMIPDIPEVGKIKLKSPPHPDIDVRLMPEMGRMPEHAELLPPPVFPENFQSPLAPVNASKDVDLRMGIVGLPPLNPIPMDMGMNDFRALDTGMKPDVLNEIDKSHMFPMEMGLRNRFPEEPRMFPNSKRTFTRFGDRESEESSQSMGAQPQQLPPPPGLWEQQPNMPTNQGSWLRPLLQPPPMMLRPTAVVEQSRFGQRWPNPPMMPSMQQQSGPLPPIRPPPAPPAGMFDPDPRFQAQFGRTRVAPMPIPVPLEPPPADPRVLDMIAADTMKAIKIDGIPREIRYYGDTAVAFISWDDPREILFQGTNPRRLTVNDKETLLLSFNAQFTDIMVDGQPHRVKLGGPTREIFFDNSFYEIFFGGPPIVVESGGQMIKLQLEGPPPQVRIGNKRADLCVGKINLIVDAQHYFTIFLDPKPQRFDLDGVAYILRFVEALETTVINGMPFKFEYGGLPRPFYARGKKYFLRFTSLPSGIFPGYVNILGMEGGRRTSPPPIQQTPISSSSQGLMEADQENSQLSEEEVAYSPGSPKRDLPQDDNSLPMGDSDIALMEAPTKEISSEQSRKRNSGKANPLEILTSLIAPVVNAPSSAYNYSVEQENNSQSGNSNHAQSANAQGTQKSSIPFLAGEVNIQELFQRLVATGIVPGSGPTPSSGAAASTTVDQEKMDVSENQKKEDPSPIKPVDFKQPDTLKVRQPGLVFALYSGIQCSSCGVRFAPEQTIKYSQHLDWHFRQNRRERDSSRTAQSRKWYYDVSDWIQFEEIEDLEERAQSWFDTQANTNAGTEEEVLKEVPSVLCENGSVEVECDICHDKFEIFYNEEREEWHLRRAIKIEDKIYHPLCYQDYMISLKTPPPEPEPEPTKMEEISAIVIDEDPVPVPEEEDDDVIIEESPPKEVIIEVIKDDEEEEEEARQKAEEEEKKRKEFEEAKRLGLVPEEVVDDDSKTKDSVQELQEVGEGAKADAESDQAKTDANNEPQTADKDSMMDIENVIKNIKKEPMVEEEDDEVEEIGNIIDLERIIVKKEKMDEEEAIMPKPVVDTTHTKVACSIDGNVELDDTGLALVTAPSKIKINISKPLTLAAVNKEPPPQPIEESEPEKTSIYQPPSASSVVPLTMMVEPSQPPPPGEEPCALHLKPKLHGRKLTELPPVSKGTELSGLCSIM